MTQSTPDVPAITMREYIDIRFAASNDLLEARWSAAQTAILKAETATDRRFESVNEFRGALTDSARLLLPRLEYDRAHSSLVEKIDTLAARVAEHEARAKGMKIGWGVFAAVLGVAISVVTTIMFVLHAAAGK